MMHRRPFLLFAALGALLVSCGPSSYVVEALSSGQNGSITQVGFTGNVTVTITIRETVPPSFDGFWMNWKQDKDLSPEYFTLSGNLEGKRIESFQRSDEARLQLRLTGDCSAAYKEKRYGVLHVSPKAFDIKNDEVKNATDFVCRFVTGAKNTIVARDSTYTD